MNGEPRTALIQLITRTGSLSGDDDPRLPVRRYSSPLGDYSELDQSCFNGKLVASPLEPDLKVRRAVPEDAREILAVLAVVADEKVHSAIDRAWNAVACRGKSS